MRIYLLLFILMWHTSSYAENFLASPVIGEQSVLAGSTLVQMPPQCAKKSQKTAWDEGEFICVSDQFEKQAKPEPEKNLPFAIAWKRLDRQGYSRHFSYSLYRKLNNIVRESNSNSVMNFMLQRKRYVKKCVKSHPQFGCYKYKTGVQWSDVSRHAFESWIDQNYTNLKKAVRYLNSRGTSGLRYGQIIRTPYDG